MADVSTHFDDLRSRAIDDGRSNRTHERHDRHAADGEPTTRDRLDDLRSVRSPLSLGGLQFGRNGNRIAVARGNVIVPLALDATLLAIQQTTEAASPVAFHLSKANLPAYFETLEDYQPRSWTVTLNALRPCEVPPNRGGPSHCAPPLRPQKLLQLPTGSHRREFRVPGLRLLRVRRSGWPFSHECERTKDITSPWNTDDRNRRRGREPEPRGPSASLSAPACTTWPCRSSAT